jgi:hypothetical protein
MVREECRAQNAFLCSLFLSPVNSFLLRPNILLSTVFSNTFSLRSSFNVFVGLLIPWHGTAHSQVLKWRHDMQVGRMAINVLQTAERRWASSFDFECGLKLSFRKCSVLVQILGAWSRGLRNCVRGIPLFFKS